MPFIPILLSNLLHPQSQPTNLSSHHHHFHFIPTSQVLKKSQLRSSHSMFYHHMDNHQGDLADVVRSRRINNSLSLNDISSTPTWQFPYTIPFHGNEDFFYDSFSSDSSRNPLLHELDIAGGSFFHTPFCIDRIKDGEIIGVDREDVNIINNSGSSNNSSSSSSRPCGGIFSRMLQLSSDNHLSQSSMEDAAMGSVQSTSGEVVVAGSSRNNFSDNNGGQISSPRSSGIKRRKSQVKKVVCIPAPAPASTRPSSGEVVPSDLWAWRKYGQKPIKGSPYPRGYYRCSSSKGCSARKQVERSRSDPNMLVITYTSEHNHPWPTQRNALAGSTRAQPPKGGGGCKSPQPLLEQKLSPNHHTDCFSNEASGVVTGSSPDASSFNKEEETSGINLGGAPMEVEEGELEQNEDFFADLDEIERDPLGGILFSNGFGDGDDGYWTVGGSSYTRRGL